MKVQDIYAMAAPQLGLTVAQIAFTAAVVDFNAFLAAPCVETADIAISRLTIWKDAMVDQDAKPKRRARRAPTPPATEPGTETSEPIKRRRGRSVPADQPVA